MRPLSFVFALLIALAGALPRAQAPAPVRDLSHATPPRFDVDEKDLSTSGVPLLKPTYTIVLDREYAGGWLTVGDLTGDGVAEIVSARNGGPMGKHYTASVAVQRLDGSVLWKWGDPRHARNILSHDVACQIHDLDGDGRNEVAIAADRKVIVFDGASGRQKLQFPIPADASDCLSFCNLTGGKRPTDILVKTRYTQIWAYDRGGRPLWTRAMPGGYKTAHQPFAIDLDGDGRDEIMAGFAMLNSDGSVRWKIPSADGKPLAGHADSIRLFRDGPRPADKRLLVTHCGGNRLTMLDGAGKALWTDTGLHFESVFFGKLDPKLPGRQLVVDVAHQSLGRQPLVILDEEGRLLGRFMVTRSRQHRLIDWFGNGTDLIFIGQNRALFDAEGAMVLRFATPMPEGAAPGGEEGIPLSMRLGNGKAGAGRAESIALEDRLAYMVHLADVNGDGRPDLVLSTVPGSAVWVYLNVKGPKILDPARLVLPFNATLY